MNKFLLLFSVLISTFGFSQTNCWKEVSSLQSHTLAIKTDGTLWAWGTNSSGQFGNGSTTSSNTPIQIGSATNWKLVNAGGEYSTAIKTDNTLWSWGKNTYGQLGNGNTTNSISPIQIGSSSNWDKISASTFSVYAINTNFDLFSWGQNYGNTPSAISCTALGLSDNTKEFLKIYPNPAKEVVYIENFSNIEYEIFDIIGKSISKGISNENQINVNSLTKGIYILKLKKDGEILKQKFIKE